MAKKKTADISEPQNCWERLPGESQVQYEKFCAYRDMKYSKSPDEPNALPQIDIAKARSIRELSKQIGTARRTLEDYSVRYDWKARADAYDVYIEEMTRLKNEKDIIKMKATHAAIAAQMLKKATRRLLTIGDEDISASDIVRLVDIGVKIERLSRGESTENQKVSGEVTHSGTVKVEKPLPIDLSELSYEELGELEQLITKINKQP